MSDKDEFFKHAREELFPRVEQSAISIAIVGTPDPKLCMEIGAMVMFDKPIIVVVPPGQTVPNNLRRVASGIVQGDMSDPTTGARLQQTIELVLKNDKRVQ